MRLHVLSDLHLELRDDGWRDLVDRIPSDLADVMVLAGDVLCFAREEQSGEMLTRLRKKARQVLYVLGNHEHYRGAFLPTKAVASVLCASSGITLLDESSITIDGRRFLGCTLWFGYEPRAQPYRHLLTDFHLISRFEEGVYEENRRAVEFLDRSTRPGDVVVTHHVPARAGIAPHFRLAPYDRVAPFFANDCEKLVERCQPALWIHGHMHVPSDWRLGETRIVCNPIGYPADRRTGRLDYTVDV
jgi:Icc-related predicted phosphoesterase